MEPILLTGEISPELAKQIDIAIKQFCLDSKIVKTSEFKGAVQQTVENVGAAIYKGGNGYGGDFWIARDNNTLVAYTLCSLSKDIDNKLTYWVLQSYIHKDYRHTFKTQEWWKAIEDRAKSLFAKHMVLIASRKPEAYIKLLGNEWHIYATLIKKDIKE